MSQWKRRNLTPIGKITVVKSLLISKLVRLFIALPNPSQKFIKDLETALLNFVWNSKRNPIKRSKLVQHCSQDGLQMLGITALLQSMKLSWLKRLLVSDTDWTKLASQQLPEISRLLTYGKEKLKTLKEKMTNPFYIDLLSALIRFNAEYLPSKDELLTDTIWFSDHTKYHKTIIKSWDKKGLRFIRDLFNTDTGELLSKREIEDRFQLSMTFLCHASLIRSLPISIRSNNVIVKDQGPNIPYRLNLVLNKPKFSRFAYYTFVSFLNRKNVTVDERLKRSWQRDIGYFSEGSSMILKTATRSTYLHYLHFRITTRMFATNRLLCSMKLSQNSHCSFCNAAVETLTHLFWHCPKVQEFILSIVSHLRINYSFHLNLNDKSWFFSARNDRY